MNYEKGTKIVTPDNEVAEVIESKRTTFKARGIVTGKIFYGHQDRFFKVVPAAFFSGGAS